MALQIHYPKKNAKHKQNLIVIQGKCDNLQKVTATLTKGGQAVVGQKLGGNAKHFGFLFKNLAAGTYTFAIDQANSPVISASVDFDVIIPPPPPPATPPTVSSPTGGAEVAVTFYPVGTSTQTITSIVFSGNGQSANGTVLQQPDANGNWVGQVDGIDAWPNGPGNLYQLAVSNAAGTTTVNNLTIAAPDTGTGSA